MILSITCLDRVARTLPTPMPGGDTGLVSPYFCAFCPFHSERHGLWRGEGVLGFLLVCCPVFLPLRWLQNTLLKHTLKFQNLGQLQCPLSRWEGFTSQGWEPQGSVSLWLESVGRRLASISSSQKFPGQQDAGVGLPCAESCPQSHRVDILGQERSNCGKPSCRFPWGQVPSSTIYHPKVWERGAHRTPRRE